MESSWRLNREEYGWGGYNLWTGIFAVAGEIQFLWELDPPVNRGFYTMTHMAIQYYSDWSSLWLGGVVFNGCFSPRESVGHAPKFKPWEVWTAKPD